MRGDAIPEGSPDPTDRLLKRADVEHLEKKVEVGNNGVEDTGAGPNKREVVAEGFLRKAEGVLLAERLEVAQLKAGLNILGCLHADANAALSGRGSLHDDVLQ